MAALRRHIKERNVAAIKYCGLVSGSLCFQGRLQDRLRPHNVNLDDYLNEYIRINLRNLGNFYRLPVIRFL